MVSFTSQENDILFKCRANYTHFNMFYKALIYAEKSTGEIEILVYKPLSEPNYDIHSGIVEIEKV